MANPINNPGSGSTSTYDTQHYEPLYRNLALGHFNYRRPVPPPISPEPRTKTITKLISELTEVVDITSLAQIHITIAELRVLPTSAIEPMHFDQLLQAITLQLKYFWTLMNTEWYQSSATLQPLLDDLLYLLISLIDDFPSYLSEIPESLLSDLFISLLPFLVLQNHFDVINAKAVVSLMPSNQENPNPKLDCSVVVDFFVHCGQTWPSITDLICTALQAFQKLNCEGITIPNYFGNELSDADISDMYLKALDKVASMWYQQHDDEVELLDFGAILYECYRLMEGYQGEGIFTLNLIPLERAKLLIQYIKKPAHNIWYQMTAIFCEAAAKGLPAQSLFIVKYIEATGTPYDENLNAFEKQKQKPEKQKPKTQGTGSSKEDQQELVRMVASTQRELAQTQTMLAKAIEGLIDEDSSSRGDE